MPPRTAADREPSTRADPPWSAVAYDHLRELARAWMGRERPGHTLQPTALVHEAYLRLADAGTLGVDDRTGFQALAAVTMRRVLVDHARRRGRAKRGGGWRRVGLAGLSADADGETDLLALDEALTRLGAEHERAARVVELRFFGGMGVEQAAAVLGVSARTIELDWQFARAWLLRELRGGEG
jgi:RNA polymerase sigma factor (TIGR02999 family)